MSEHIKVGMPKLHLLLVRSKRETLIKFVSDGHDFLAKINAADHTNLDIRKFKKKMKFENKRSKMKFGQQTICQMKHGEL